LRKPSKNPVPEPAPAKSELHQYIPEELMKKLQAVQDQGGMIGERRVVTMLFCDLKGSTAAAEGLDPEDWTEIMNGAFEQMIKPVYQYEGTIARLMGDALLAFFGAPIAHEDDPRRAVLAGLDIVEAIKPYREQIRERYGVDFDVRVGINTGLVVVGAVGSDLRMEYSALGDAINLAARMEQTAEPGTVRIAHDTYKLVKNLFEFKSLGGVEVKGKSEPVLAYQAVGRKFETSQTRGIEGLHATMVGRDAELSTLHNVMADLKQGLGRIIFVLGEAGLGKTRLIGEAHQVF
jgi:class 3 adenylate cyclase